MRIMEKMNRRWMLTVAMTGAVMMMVSCKSDEPGKPDKDNADAIKREFVFKGIQGLFSVDYLIGGYIEPIGLDAIYGLTIEDSRLLVSANFRDNTLVIPNYRSEFPGYSTLNSDGLFVENHTPYDQGGSDGSNHSDGHGKSNTYYCKYDKDKRLIEYVLEHSERESFGRFYPPSHYEKKITDTYTYSLLWEDDRITAITVNHINHYYEYSRYESDPMWDEYEGKEPSVTEKEIDEERVNETTEYKIIYDDSKPAVNQYSYAFAYFLTGNKTLSACMATGLMGKGMSGAPIAIEGKDFDGTSVRIDIKPIFNKRGKENVIAIEEVTDSRTDKTEFYKYAYLYLDDLLKTN